MSTLSPEIRDLSPLGIDAYPLEGEVQRILARPAPAGWTPSGLTREAYLDLMEPMVRTAATWVSDEGALIDPVLHREWAQSTPRFVSSAAVLLHFGRIADLQDVVFKSMSYCCARLADPGIPKSASADFWMRELVTAYDCLAPIASAAHVNAWKKDLAAVRPEDAYVAVDPSHANLKRFHNWAVYSSAGESMREAAGLGGPDGILWGNRFFDTYMAAQTHRFTACGMYRDPDDPITYDITTRLQFAAAIARGYNGPLRPALDEILRRGNQTLLLFVSPDGFVPFGGRSSQFNFQEAITSALSELEARRHRDNDPALAGAFKRQARLAASSVRPWFADSVPARHIKNRFAPQTRHGCDTYGQYSVYSMLATSCFGLAALYADDMIAEHPTPAEIGGYALKLQPAFHKIFLCAEGAYVEIDTQADPNHDATGIGRILFKGLPPGFPLGMPFSARPKCIYAEGFSAPERPVALGPAWQGPDGAPDSLASWSSGVRVKTKTIETNGIVSGVATVYRKGKATVHETVRVARDNVTLDWNVTIAGTPVNDLGLTLPCLLSDGENQATLAPTVDGAVLAFRGQSIAFRWNADMRKQPDDAVIANRNGVYRVLRLVSASGLLHLDIRPIR
ncbi:MAG: hypothetical protein ACOX9C_08245 [Kiritimatiellia bacterium]